MQQINVLVVDDHPVINAGLVKLLEGNRNIKQVYTCAAAAEALERARMVNADVALVDIALPDRNGIELCRTLKKEHPALKVVIFTMHTEKAYVLQSLGAGANGYIVKTVKPDRLLNLLLAAAQGKMVLCDQAELAMGSQDTALATGGFGLTGREKEVLRCICRGLTNNAIAEELFLSVLTVETHRKNIMQKLGTRNAVELTRRAIELKLV